MSTKSPAGKLGSLNKSQAHLLGENLHWVEKLPRLAWSLEDKRPQAGIKKRTLAHIIRNHEGSYSCFLHPQHPCGEFPLLLTAQMHTEERVRTHLHELYSTEGSEPHNP